MVSSEYLEMIGGGQWLIATEVPDSDDTYENDYIDDDGAASDEEDYSGS